MFIGEGFKLKRMDIFRNKEVIKICYGMGCRWENHMGECRKPRNGVCLDGFETEEEYLAAEQAAEDKADDYADFKYEQMNDREMKGYENL